MQFLPRTTFVVSSILATTRQPIGFPCCNEPLSEGRNSSLHSPDTSLAKDEAEADRILAKISESGMDSLTRAERKTLERHSRRKRADRARSVD